MTEKKLTEKEALVAKADELKLDNTGTVAELKARIADAEKASESKPSGDIENQAESQEASSGAGKAPEPEREGHGDPEQEKPEPDDNGIVDGTIPENTVYNGAPLGTHPSPTEEGYAPSLGGEPLKKAKQKQ